MGRRERGYEHKQASLKKGIRIANIIIASIFIFIGALILIFNVTLLIGKASNTDGRSQDFAKIGNYYLITVGTETWSDFCPINSLIIVKEENVSYSYFMLGEEENASNDDRQINDARKNALYLIRMEDGEETSYTIGKVDAKVQEGVLFQGGAYVTYDNVIGTLEVTIPFIAIMQNLVFVLLYLFLLVVYIASLIIFSYTDLGFDMLFEKEFKSEIKKDSTFAFVNREIKKDEQDLTDEERVNNLLHEIISDFEDKGKDAEIPLENVRNAVKVIGAVDYTSKEKIFVCLASLNLMNAYVKREDADPDVKKKYWFKRYVQSLAEYVQEKQSADVKVFEDKDLLMFECLGMQFSFHNVKLSFQPQQKDWSGVKLQPYANKIFELLYEREFLGYDFGTLSPEIIKVLKDLN